MRTVKSLLGKGEDPHKALMDKLQPKWPDLQAFKKKDQDMKEKQTFWFNKRHCTKERKDL